MGNKNIQTIFSFKKIVQTISLVLLLGAMTACNKGGGSSNDTPAPTPVVVVPSILQSCTNCGTMSPATLATVTATTPIQASLTLSGDSATMSTYTAAYPNARLVNIYSGSVILSGTMTIATAAQVGTCPLPAGTYSLWTVSVGYTNAVQFVMPSMTATGPATLTLGIGQGMVYNFGTSVSGNMYLQSVNGAACNGVIYFN